MHKCFLLLSLSFFINNVRGMDIDLAKLVAMCKSEDWATLEWPVENFQLPKSNTPHSLTLTHLSWGGIFFSGTLDN